MALRSRRARSVAATLRVFLATVFDGLGGPVVQELHLYASNSGITRAGNTPVSR